MYEAVQNGEEITAEIVAEAAWGSALDNAGDMLDTDPLSHARAEYEGYVGHIIYSLEGAMEEHGRSISDEELDHLEEAAIEAIEKQKL